MNECNTTEQMLQKKGLNAPRLNPEHIENTIKKAEFFKLTDVLTVCVLTLQNAQARVQVSPIIMNVACLLLQHSEILGQLAS